MTNRKQRVDDFMNELAVTRRLLHGSGDHTLARFDLTRTQIAVLFLLKQQERATVGEVASSLGTTGGAATQTIEIMVRRGLVQRAPDPSDRRVTWVSLDQGGHELAREVTATVEARLSTILEELTDEELDTLVASMNRLNRATKNYLEARKDKDKEH